MLQVLRENEISEVTKKPPRSFLKFSYIPLTIVCNTDFTAHNCLQYRIGYFATYIVDIVDFNCGSELVISFHCNGKSCYNKLWSILMMLLHLKSYTCHSLYNKSIFIQMMLNTEFHWFHRSRHHSQISSLVFLRFWWCKKKGLISCTAIVWFCFLYRMSSALSLSSSFPRLGTTHCLKKFPMSLLDCGSFMVSCNLTRWF